MDLSMPRFQWSNKALSMGSASRAALNRQARLAGSGAYLAKKRNTADERFTARPKGAARMIQYGVAVLAKDMAILCELRLVLDHLGCSESIDSALLDH